MHVNKLLSEGTNHELHAPKMPLRSPRCTGRTTAIALELIAAGIKEQGHRQCAVDHVGGSPRALFGRVRALCKQMGLTEVQVTLASDHVVFQSDIWE